MVYGAAWSRLAPSVISLPSVNLSKAGTPRGEVLRDVRGAFNLFSNASGLSVNRNNSEIMPVHSLDKDQIEGFEVKHSVRYLGILISKSQTDRIVTLDTFSQRIHKSKNICNCWLQGNLPIHGCVLISKAGGVSRIVYPALSLLTLKHAHLLTMLCYLHFCGKIKLKMLKGSYWSEILWREVWMLWTLVAYRPTLNQVFKIGWIKRCLNADPNLLCFYIPKLIFEKCGGYFFISLRF